VNIVLHKSVVLIFIALITGPWTSSLSISPLADQTPAAFVDRSQKGIVCSTKSYQLITLSELS